MMLGSLLGALALAAWAAVRAPWAFYLAWALIGVSMAGVLYEPAFAVLTAQFRKDAPRAIIALSLVGGFASTVCMPLVQALISWLGWRSALWILAAANLGICLPLHACFVPRRPGGSAGTPDIRPAPALGGVYHGLVSERRFWGLAIWFTACSLVTAALVFQTVPLLTAWGLGAPAALGCMMLFGPMQVAGRLAWMGLGARAGVRSMGLVSAASFAAALAGLLLLPHRAAWLGPAVAAFGLGNGVLTILRGTAVPELLGAEHYGTVNGVLALPVMAARAFGPVAAAALWSWSGAPGVMLWALLGCALAGSGGYLLAVAGPPRAEPGR